MAGRIRDAIIRVRLEVVDQDPMRKVLREQKKYTKEVEKSKASIKSVEKAIVSLMEKVSRFLEQAIKKRDDIIRKERALRAEIEKRVQSEKKAAEAAKGPGCGVGGALGAGLTKSISIGSGSFALPKTVICNRWKYIIGAVAARQSRPAKFTPRDQNCRSNDLPPR